MKSKRGCKFGIRNLKSGPAPHKAKQGQKGAGEGRRRAGEGRRETGDGGLLGTPKDGWLTPA